MLRKNRENNIPESLFWDASYLIAYLAPGDQYHKKALKLRKHLTHKKIKLITSWPIISEASTILFYHYGYSHALALFSALKAFEIIMPFKEEYQEATLLFEELNQDQKLSFNDVLTYLIIRKRLKNISLLTFDKDFSKVGLTIFIP